MLTVGVHHRCGSRSICLALVTCKMVAGRGVSSGPLLPPVLEELPLETREFALRGTERVAGVDRQFDARQIPDRAAAVQTIFYDSHLLPGSIQVVFENAGPTLLKSQPVTGVGNDAPSQRIGIDQNVLHGRAAFVNTILIILACNPEAAEGFLFRDKAASPLADSIDSLDRVHDVVSVLFGRLPLDGRCEAAWQGKVAEYVRAV